MSTSLYTTFGNELDYKITQDTLVAYLKNATIKFPLPEASSTILSEIVDDETINPVDLDVVKSRLIKLGFKEPNARALSAVLLSAAKTQGVDPMTYFDVNENTLKLAVDTYNTINMMRPPGNRINLVTPKNNQRSRQSALIKP
jgi:hypothetical protein